MNGRLLPLGWWHFLRTGKIIDRVRVGFLGVKPEFQHTGVAAQAVRRALRHGRASRPQTWGEMGWILETNKNMNRAMEAMGGRIVRRFRVYERDLDFRLRCGLTRYRLDMRRSDYLKASPPMFESRLLDRFTRVHPVVPVLIYAPVDRRPARPRGRPRRVVGHARARLVGYAVWTLFEYWLHRVVFHFEPEDGIGARLHWMIHGVHHDHPNDPLRLVMPPAASIPLARGRGRRDLPGRSAPCTRPAVARGLPDRLPDLRRDPLRPAPPHADVAARQAAARAAHAPPLPGRRARASASARPYWDVVFRTYLGAAARRAERSRPGKPSCCRIRESDARRRRRDRRRPAGRRPSRRASSRRRPLVPARQAAALAATGFVAGRRDGRRRAPAPRRASPRRKRRKGSGARRDRGVELVPGRRPPARSRD